MDTCAEMRSIMAVLSPAAPVGVLVDNLEDAEGTPIDRPQMSSHDAYGMCMDIVARIGDDRANRERMRTQTEIYRAYREALLAVAVPKDLDSADPAEVRQVGACVYNLMCGYTHANLTAYFPRCRTMRFAFVPIEGLDNTLRARVCQWLAAREILQGQNPEASAVDHGFKDLFRVYCECAAIIQAYESDREDEMPEEDEKDARRLLRIVDPEDPEL